MNYKIEISEEVLQYLQMFLNRVPLEGKEVPLFVDVVNSLKTIQDE
ncbi:hypothetical protein [Clostridium rectalis]|nr:hypothetical protein [Clostridium rectalis]